MTHTSMRASRRFRRPIGALAITAIAATALVACSSSGGGTTGVDGGGIGTAENPVEIRVLANEAFAKAWQDKLVPEFNKDFPYIKVDIDGVPYSNLLAKGVLDLTGASPEHDILITDDPWTPQLASTGGLLDLETEAADWTDADYDWDDFYDAALAASEWDDKQYGVPLRSNLLLMFYNKSLYQAAGVAEPTPELTWDTFMEQAPQLVQDTDGDGETDSWAGAMTWARDPLSPTIWQSVLDSNGGELFDDEMNPTFDNKAGVAALRTQIDLLDYAPAGATNYNYNEPLDAFRQGKVASIFTWGSAYKSAAVDQDVTTLTPDQVGIQTMPAGSESAATHRGIWSGSVVKKSENPEAAWALLQWMSSKKGETWAVNNLGSFPARESTLSTAPEQEWMVPVFAAIQEGFVAAEAGDMWRPRSPQSNAIQEILADQTSAAVNGQVSADAALKKASEQIKKLLK
ncbi:ABC transporter substrate-binding protein [Leifsonia sp. A12D58]|uniref:ABC transporter substrate-binding protein n=1 Tax=Leifsonia sp. A12D58 TaxID=3397674 RepID=UPI0039DF622D